ncbi:MAG TPA: hypothetical protein VGE98_16250, partial [Thermoanaerobaculia bacterium]
VVERLRAAPSGPRLWEPVETTLPAVVRAPLDPADSAPVAPVATTPEHVEALYEHWDDVRRASSLEVAATGSALGRLWGFLRRTGGRVRDLGIAWDRERDLLRALVDQQTLLERRVAAIELREHEGRLWEEAAPRLHGLLDTQRRQLEARLDAGTQEAVEELEARLLSQVAGRTAPLAERVRQIAANQQQIEGRLREGLGGLRAMRRKLPTNGHGEVVSALTGDGLVALFAAVEREIPALARTRAVEVSIQDVRAEALLLAADRYFGPRLSARGAPYRSPNDVWFHVDFTAQRERPILFDNAAARLCPGGHFVLVTEPPEPSPAEHPALRPAGSHDLTATAGTPLRVLVWERL